MTDMTALTFERDEWGRLVLKTGDGKTFVGVDPVRSRLFLARPVVGRVLCYIFSEPWTNQHLGQSRFMENHFRR